MWWTCYYVSFQEAGEASALSEFLSLLSGSWLWQTPDYCKLHSDTHTHTHVHSGKSDFAIRKTVPQKEIKYRDLYITCNVSFCKQW